MAINLTKNEEQLTNEIMSKINLSKDKEALGGYVLNLSKSIINLSKKADIDIGNVRARVMVVLDYSGSMDSDYRYGNVQRVLNKLVPLGLSFDDNGELDVFIFDSSDREVATLNINNYSDYVQKEILDKFGYPRGSTNYAPPLKTIMKMNNPIEKKKGLFGLRKEIVSFDNSGDKFFVIFITDGDNFDKKETDTVVRQLSHSNTFIQFIGVGKSNFDYLEKLDDLDGRPVDNTGFSKFNSLKDMKSDAVYNAVLEQFAEWLKAIG